MEEVAKLTQDYPHFDDGRIDYTHARECPVLNCTVVYEDEVLLAFRSKDVIAYPETWNGISGFIDEIKPFKTIVQEELNEEVGIAPETIKRIIIRPKIIQKDDAINRVWHVWPVLVELNHRPKLTTNWENKQARWVPKNSVLTRQLMPGYAESFKIAIGENEYV